MSIQNAIRNSEKFQEQISNVSGGGLQLPDKTRWCLFESPAAPLSAASNPVVTNDVISTTDSGANNLSLNPPDAINGASITLSVVGGGFGHNLRTWQGMFWIYPQRLIVIKGTLRYRYDIVAAQGEYLVGLCDTGGGVDPRTVGLVMVGIEKIANVPAGNWILFVGNGGVVTRVDTGVPVNQDERDTFTIVISGGVVGITINGLARASTNANLPSNPLGINWYIHGNATGAGGTNFMTFEYLYAENSTP